MTLGEALGYVGDHPMVVIITFLVIPCIAWLWGELDRNRGAEAPWKYGYTVLIYLSMIPGIFSAGLLGHLILIEQQSILDIDLMSQIIPIVSMILTLWIIRRQVDLDLVPGFDRLSGLVMVIIALLVGFWILDRFRIIAFTHLPLQYLFILFAGLALLITLGVSKLGKSS